MKNPFHTTKASYYDDTEILQFWVSPESSEKKFFHTVMEPTESMPIMILGGKGSGKTHILRYFSFNSQTIRANTRKISLLKQIQEDGYIGIYIVSSGLQASRFSGGKLNVDEWRDVFFYYINLEFIERFLRKIATILSDANKTTIYNMNFLKDHMRLEKTDTSQIDLHQLYEYVKSKRIDIDSQLASLRLPGGKSTLKIEPILHQIEDGFYAIIDQILSAITDISGIKILYILDEYENFSESQQKYFNTLLRQPSKYQKKIGFRVSGRLWSVKTWHTYDDEEILQVESEIKLVHLENIIQKKYSNFTKKLYKKRIENILRIDPTSVNFNESFEDSKTCNNKEKEDIFNKHKEKEKKHFRKLKNYLNNEERFEKIKETLSCGDYFLEKLNILLLFKKWNKSDLEKESILIKNSCEKYLETKNGTYKSQIDKYETYVLYQLFRDYGRSVSYSGYKTIVQLSANNPRIFLSILSNIYKECVYQNINLFTEDSIPCNIQDKAILESSKWFWNNFTEDIKDERVEWAIVKICELFRAIYRSENPTEKDLVMFSYDEIEIDKAAKEVIKRAIDHSLLIDEGFRKDRNSGKKLKLLRLHPMLSPRWELSVSAGGAFAFKKLEIESLFLKEEKSWEKIERDILNRYKITQKKDQIHNDSLFSVVEKSSE